MRVPIATVILATALVASAGMQTSTRPADSLERPFVQNGKIRMDLSAGQYFINGSKDNRIRIGWTAHDEDTVRKAHARADVRGREATITADGPTNNTGLRFTIDLPNQTDLYIRLTAGDITIEDVRGNKDVELHAGDLSIDVGRPEDYNHVDASLWAGDLHAAPFNVVKGGLFRSFDWNGKGPYRLHAKMKAGDLRLYSKSGL
jgi:hypothetical protein